jgi:hypothetical protein
MVSRASRKLSGQCLPTDLNFPFVDISGQSLPTLALLLTIDVLWSDLHMVHESRSLMGYDSFYCAFRTA